MSKATEELMDALHGLAAQTLINEIKAYSAGEHVDKEGNPLPVPASILAAAIKFLKDNGVDRPGRDEDVEDKLSELLPANAKDLMEFEGQAH
ncbi:MAG: hypothetical protein AAF628_08320 [Planctomycetota bacterium]